MNNGTETVNTVCHPIEFGLRAIGVWPGTSYAILRRVFCISSVIMFQTFQYQHLIMHFGDEDLLLLMDVLSATLAYSLLLIKLIIFAFNARLLNVIIERVIEDRKECDVCDEYMMTRMAYISRRFSNFIITLYALSVFLYATGTLLRYKSNNQTDTRELILKMELPFEIKSTSVHIVVLIIQFVHQTSGASLVGVMNSLLITLVLHVCGQIDIVRQKLSEITRKDIKRGVNESIVKILIIRHQKIISLSKNIEAFFSNIALIQFVSNTLVICCLGFLIVISIGVPGGSSMLIKSVFFYIVMSMEAFIFCFLGEYLSTKSQKIGDAAYESLWYELNPNQNRDVLLMIIRSQKHLTLTVGKVMDLSLKQFAGVRKLEICNEKDNNNRNMKVENTVSKVIEIWLQIFGVWPNTSCVLLRRLFWTVMLVIEQAFQYRYIVDHFYLIKFSDMMNILSLTMAYTIFSIKLIILWFKQRTFNEILTIMAIDWEKCSSTKFSMFTTTSNVKLSKRFTNITVILYSTSVIIFSSGILVKHADNGIISNVSTRLLLDMDLPFDANRRFVYESIIIIQFLHLLLCSDAMGLINALLITLILHISGQIDILRKSLMEIFPKERKLSPSCSMIKEIIQKHKKIIIFSEHIENLFSYVALVMFISDTLIMCFLGFTIVTSIGRSDGSESIIKSVSFYLVMNMQTFVFCLAGEYLSAKSKSIGDAAYNSLWYKSNSKDSRIILLLIMRSQNRLTITIGKIMNLSLEQFSSIVKASASYMSVLLAMY
ncbi:uncharacterized protein [Temnothorax nylanderi]|uniref:uncharacterized protein n=1 Tax=Temnothorax nylanderi TaxID=102681 RepID=UPI003A8887D7